MTGLIRIAKRCSEGGFIVDDSILYSVKDADYYIFSKLKVSLKVPILGGYRKL